MVWSRIRSLVRGLVSRSAVEREMDAELQFHLDLRARHWNDQGYAPADAMRRAKLEFGGVEGVKEQARESRGLRPFDEIRGDLRYGLRTLRRDPGFALIAVLTLALGIGANTAMFSALDAVLLRPLPFAEPHRLVEMDAVNIPSERFGEDSRPKSYPDLQDARALNVFTSIAAYAPGALNLSGVGAPRRVNVGVVTDNFFETIGVAPVRGRSFSEEEGRPNGPRVALVSYAFWRSQLGGAALAGQNITLNGTDYAVIGVLAPGFAFPEQSEIWIPLTVPVSSASWEPFRQYIPSRLIARLAPDVTVATAAQRFRSLFTPYVTEKRPLDDLVGEGVRPLQGALVGERGKVLLILLGSTTLVLLVACANVANLLLSRSSVRRREFAVRAAIGATPARVFRQLLVESVLLATIAGALGIAIAVAAVRLLDALVPRSLAGAAPIQLDARVLAFTVSVSVLAGVFFGIAPALAARRSNAGLVLKSGGTGSVAAGHSARVRQAFVLAELALAVMLLIGSALMLRSLQTLLNEDSGVRPERVATLELTLARADYPNTEARRQLYTSVLEQLDRLPEVEAAAVINELPMRGEGGVRFTVYPEGRRPEVQEVDNMAQDLRITSDYFRAMGIRVLLGRAPRPQADTAAPGEVAINRMLAQFYWPDQNPIGQRLVTGFETRVVVGVVENVRSRSLESEAIPQAYYPLLESPYSNAAIIARGRVSEDRLIGALERAVRQVAPNQAVYNVRSMEQVIGSAIASRTTNTALITAFGVLAVILAAIGVYGVVAFGVARRTSEIGIRIALGARPGQVRRAMLNEAGVLALLGIALGTTAAWMLSRVLNNLVYGISTTDVVAFTIAPVVLLATAAVAALIPAQRATRVDPVRAIQAE